MCIDYITFSSIVNVDGPTDFTVAPMIGHAVSVETVQYLTQNC